MPVPPVTARDEPWPFFLYWRHRFWPKLASSILNSCRRKRSFQWRPDQSDRPNGTLDMHKNAEKVEWKTWSKISCHCKWMLHAKNHPSRWRFLRSFLTASRPSRRSSTAAKTREKEKKETQKKFHKSKSLKTYVTFSSRNYSMLLYSTLRYPTLPYSYSTLLYSTLRFSTLHNSTLLYSMLLYTTLLYAPLL